LLAVVRLDFARVQTEVRPDHVPADGAVAVVRRAAAEQEVQYPEEALVLKPVVLAELVRVLANVTGAELDEIGGLGQLADCIVFIRGARRGDRTQCKQRAL
jgi:hypothetical protein